MDDSSNENSVPNYVIVPQAKLSEEAFNGLIDEFILREGTDYGQREFTLEEKHAQIHRQLNNGSVLIVFDMAAESASLMRKENFRSR